MRVYFPLQKDQLQIVESETKNLMTELETVRQKKHEVEEARAKAAIQRDNHIEKLLSENRILKERTSEMSESLQKKDAELKENREEMAKIESALFKTKSEVGAQQRLNEAV